MRVLLLIGSLVRGGAQRQMARLATGLAATGHEVCVATLVPGGQFWDHLATDSSLQLKALYSGLGGTTLSRGLQLAGAVPRLRRLMHDFGPSVVLSSLSLSNLIAYGAWRRQRRPPLVWSIRSSAPIRPLRRRLIVSLASRYAGEPAVVIYNSHAGRTWHLRHGFPAKNARVILNGIDIESFRRQEREGQRLRRSWGVDDSEVLIGSVARLSPMKDHTTLLQAAARVAAVRPEVRWICVGDGPPGYTAALAEKSRHLGLDGRLVWAGRETDMPAVYSALDLFVSSSAYGEGFSNAIAEAMACELPCVVTDCGDARIVVGDTGWVVPVRDPGALGEAILTLLDEPPERRRERSLAGRRRIADNFPEQRMVEETTRLLAELVEEV